MDKPINVPLFLFLLSKTPFPSVIIKFPLGLGIVQSWPAPCIMTTAIRLGSYLTFNHRDERTLLLGLMERLVGTPPGDNSGRLPAIFGFGTACGNVLYAVDGVEAANSFAIAGFCENR